MHKTGMPVVTGATREPPALPPRITVDILTIHRAEITPAWWKLDLRSPFWRLYWMEDSGASVTCGGHTYALEPDHVHLIPPWVLFHTATTTTQVQSYCHFLVHEAATQHLGNRLTKPVSVPAEPWLQGPLAAWTAVMQHSHPDVFQLHGWAALVVEAALLQASACQAQTGDRHAPPPTMTRAILQPAIEAIEQRPEDPPSNAELAALCNLGPDHFLRQFRACCGVTPGQYRLERRLRLAAEMLVADDRPLDAIAAATGFSDRFYLSRVFTRRMGQGPAAYRRMHRRETR